MRLRQERPKQGIAPATPLTGGLPDICASNLQREPLDLGTWVFTEPLIGGAECL
jgi:hypothetical protein